MADKTESQREVGRTEAATHLRELADELDGEGEIQVTVGNKTVTLSPTEVIDEEIEVTERSSALRGNRQGIDIRLKWKGK